MYHNTYLLMKLCKLLESYLSKELKQANNFQFIIWQCLFYSHTNKKKKERKKCDI